MKEKHILNLGKKEALCIMVRNRFYNGSWDKMEKEISSGSLKEFISLKTVQLLKSYEENNKINLGHVPVSTLNRLGCTYRNKHRRVKQCRRKTPL